MKYRIGAMVIVLSFAVGLLWLATTSKPITAIEPPLEPLPAAASAESVHRFCGACHAYPPPDSFPREYWRREVKQAYEFARASDLRLEYPGLESVVPYYERQAPEWFPDLDRGPPPTKPMPIRFETCGLNPPNSAALAGVTNVRLASLLDPKRLDLLVCTCNPGRVWSVTVSESPPVWRCLAEITAPAHVEVVDLDRDGHLDLLVADLGSFFPTNNRVGKVIWLRNDGKGAFAPITLLEGVGRVADVQAADFNGDGKLDIVVAVFGWRTTGEIAYLENRTTDWARPTFERKTLDARAGTIHLCVGDVNNDSKPDVVALISQGFETVVAFVNRGDGTFQEHTIHDGPHPAFGSSGIQLADINKDGKVDVLYSNGDTLDYPYLLKPYHGVQWLENRGNFPFVPHRLASMYGVMRAEAIDVDGDGDLDVIAVGFLPEEHFPQRKEKKLESIVLLEQTEPGRFQRHTLETESCDHLTFAVGDLFGNGRNHLVTGNFLLSPQAGRKDLLTLWKNIGPRK